MAEPKTNPFAIPGLTDTDETLAEIAQKNVERVTSAQVEVKEAAERREQERQAGVERGVAQASRPPKVDDDGDLTDDEEREANAELDRYLAPVQGAARNLDQNSTIVGYKRQPPQPILSLTDEEIEAKRTAGESAFDVYRAIYDDVEGDRKKLRARIYNREDERVKALAVDRDAMEAIVELVEDETEPYSWTYRNIYKRLGADPESDEESVQQTRKEFGASRAARAIRLGPNKTAFTEQISVMTPASIAELDLSATQRELIDSYREKLYTDAAFEPGKQLSQEERSVIEAEAVRLATDDIEGAMSRLGRPRIYSMTADKTPYEMAQENKEKGTSRILDGAALSILEAKLRPRYAPLPTEAGVTDTALIGGTNTLMMLGQVLMTIDPTEWVGTAMDVAKREYKRNIKEEEDDGDGDVDFSDVVLAAGKAAAAGNYSMALQVAPFTVAGPMIYEAGDAALGAVEPESLGAWREQVVEDTIVAAGDNEDLFDAATGSIPTFVAAANRAVTGEDMEPEIRKWFLENQMAAKTALFAGAVAVPSVPIFDVLRGAGDVITPGLRRVKAAPAEMATKIERELGDIADDANFDVDRVATDIGNAHGISADVIIRGVAESAAANAAEQDANLLRRNVDELLKGTREASVSLRNQAEAVAQRAAMNKAGALDDVLQQADMSMKLVDDLQQQAVTPEFRALRNPADTAALSQAEAEAASSTFGALGRWQQELVDGDPGAVGGLQRLAMHMDDVLKETDDTRQAIEASVHNVDLSIMAMQNRLTPDLVEVVAEVSRAEKTIARGFTRLADMKKNNPTMAKVIEGIELHARNLRNQAALRKRLQSLRQSGQTGDITMPRADVEAKIKALDDLDAAGTKLTREQQVERVMLKDRLRVTAAQSADVRIFSVDVARTIHAMKNNAQRIKQSAQALDDLKVANPKLHGEAQGIISDMGPAARVLSDIDKMNIAASTKIAQRELRRLIDSKNKMVRMYGQLDAVDAFVVLKSREKYKGIAQRVKLKDSVLDEVTRRRGAAVMRAKVIAVRRAVARAAPDAKEAAAKKAKEAFKDLRKAEGEANLAARAAAAQRLRQAQREALLRFAKSLRRGAQEVDKRRIRGKSLTYRTGRPDEDLTIIDRARNALDSALGEANVFGREVSEAQFVDLVRRAVATVQDDIIKHMDDVEDVKYVAERFAPDIIDDVTLDALKTLDGRRALLSQIVQRHADSMWRNFSVDNYKVKVENLRQAVTEAVDVAMQTRRAERDLSATMVMQQSIWARQGAIYAIYKLLSPRTGFIGEGSDQAWRVYQHADQTSAGFQAWLVLSSKKAIDEITKSGGKFSRSELAQRLIDTVSEAFDSSDGLARLGLPVDMNSPFQVAKRFFTERTPSAHEPTLTPDAQAVQATTEVAGLNREIEKLSAEQARHARAHAENRLVASRRQDKVDAEQASLARLENELAALQKESADNATAAAEAKVRRDELLAQRAAAEIERDAPPAQVLDAVRAVEDDVLSRLTEDAADIKARITKLDAEIKAMTEAVAPVLNPRQRADRALQIKQKQKDLEVLKNKSGRVRSEWEAQQQQAAAARATLLGGDKNTPPPPIMARMQQELESGKTAEQVVKAALDEAERVPWAMAKRVRQAIDPDQRMATVGGWADTARGDIEAALRDLAPSLNGKDSWRRVSPKTEAMLRRMFTDEAEKPTNNMGRIQFLSDLDAAKTVLDARRVLADFKKKAVAYQTNKQAMIDQVLGYLKRVEPTETFEQSDIYKRYAGSVFDAEEEIARLKRSLDTTQRKTDPELRRLESERTTARNELASANGKVTAQKARVKALSEGRAADVKSAALDAHRLAQTQVIKDIDDQVRTITTQIGEYERFATRDLTNMIADVARRQKGVSDLRDALKTANDRATESKKRLTAAATEEKAIRTKIQEIVQRSAGLSPADVRSALQEGAFDEAALSVFDKMILNMGRSVFRGVQASNISDVEANRLLYAIALDSIKKSNNFAELHKNIKDGILGRINGSKVIDERAPRTVNSLAAALIQGIVSEYTSQYALREGLAIMDKNAARSFNALFNREIANSSGNGLNVIKDMYATLDEVLRVGARVARVSEGKSTIVGVERRAGDEMRLVEAAKLPGFAEGVWVPENVFKTALEDLESYARQMDVLVPTAPAEVGNWLLEKGKRIFSIWRTKVLVGYGINKLGYRTRAIIGDIGSVYMVLGPKEAAKLAAVSLPNYLPFVRESAIRGTASLAKLPKKALDSLVATSTALKNGTDPVRLLAPGSWRNLPRRSVAAILDTAAVVPSTLMGLAPVHVSGLLSGSPQGLLKIGSVEQTVGQWWQEMRVEGILDNNVQINLRTGLKQNTEIWADLTARRYSWFTVERRYRELRKTQPNISREDVRQMLEADDVARPLSVSKRIKYALMRHQESLEKTEAEVHVTTRVALYASLREKGLTAKEAADGVKAAVYDWNYGANRAALNMLAFVPFGRFHILRQAQGVEVLNLAGDTSPWRAAGGGTGAIRRADLLQRYMASVTGFDIPTEEELDAYLADARGYGMSMADEWGMSQAEAATAAQQETLDFLISAWWARSHSPDYMANRQYFYEFIPPEQQAAFQQAYGTDPGSTLAMTSNVPPMGVMDAFDVLTTGAALAEITYAHLNGEDRVAENAMAKLATPWFEKLPDVAKAALAVLSGKAGLELDAIEQGRHTPQMLAAAKPAEALLLNTLGYAPVTIGISQEPIRELLTTTRGDDSRPRTVGFYSKSLLAAMRLDPILTPHLTKAIDAAAYKNPKFGQDWDAIRAAYTLANLVGLTSYNVTDPMREAKFDARDVQTEAMKKKQVAEGKAAQGERALNAREP